MNLAVACFLWDGDNPARVKYGVEHVRALEAMCSRFLPPHRFLCFSDRIIPNMETIQIEGLFTLGKRFPKLAAWRSDVGEIFAADRALILDLDCVIVDDLAPLIDRPEPVVIWKDPASSARRTFYNTSMILMTPGAHPEVWSKFDGKGARGLGPGTDQAWVRHILGPDVPTWDGVDGVYSYKRHCQQSTPENARVVFFHGRPKPWDLPHGDPLRKAYPLQETAPC